MTVNGNFFSQWRALFPITGLVSLTFFDQTAIAVALPSIQTSLNLSDVQTQWVINTYYLMIAAFALGLGSLSDRIGHKKSFLIGLIIFMISAFIISFSFHSTSLLLFRAMQGFGAAFMFPAAGALIFEIFPHSMRGKAFGIYVAVGSIFLSVGPFFGGWMTQEVSWRLIFVLEGTVALISFFGTKAWVPYRKGKEKKMDFGGFIILPLGLSLFVITVMHAPYWGLLNIKTLVLASIAFFLLFLFYFLERRVKHPLFDFKLFRKRSFLGSNLILFIAQFALVVVVFWNFFFQRVLGLDPYHAGLYSLLSSIPIFITAPIAGYLVDKMGVLIPVILGILMVLFTNLWFYFTLGQKDIHTLIPALITFGSGISMVLSSLSFSTINALDETTRGIAGGMMMTFRQVGSTLGLAIYGGIYLEHLSNITLSLEHISFLSALLLVLALLLSFFLIPSKKRDHSRSSIET